MDNELQQEPLDLSVPNQQETGVDFATQLQLTFFEFYTQFLNNNFLKFVNQVTTATSSSNDESSTVTTVESRKSSSRSNCASKRRRDSSCHVEELKTKIISNSSNDRKHKETVTSKRVEANARERNRVQQLSKMFDSLRDCLPMQDELKISKLSTLKVASAYIDFLNAILSEDSSRITATTDKLETEMETARTLRK